jgi:membrane-bound lytic murein transglycosylase A
MVHHTINTNKHSAPSASRNNSSMNRTGSIKGRWAQGVGTGLGTRLATRLWSVAPGRAPLRQLGMAVIVGSLVACASGPVTDAPPVSGPQADNLPLPPAIARGNSRWTPVRWSELPGWGRDNLHEAWNAWVLGCERPAPSQVRLCAEARPLAIATAAEQQAWVESRFQPYRVDEADGSAGNGLLTGYYEPILEATRLPTATNRTPLYGPPPGLRNGQAWYSRRDIDTRADVQAQLRGRELAWLADPIDALVLQIQGSGRLNITEPDGRRHQVRLAFAGHNGQPYRSVGRWLLDQGAIRDGSWEGIRGWVARNPSRLDELLWSNPRTVFFREEALTDFNAQLGPRGAQGVPLTPGRSIAVDPRSIPYGTPVWLATQGSALNAQRLVLAQDTGGAIVGAVRADLFTGWGGWNDAAYREASVLKQPLQMWVLWPRAGS